MRTIYSAAALAVSFALVTTVSAQLISPLKIGYVNTTGIVDKYSCAKEAEAKMKKDYDKAAQEVQARQDEIKGLQDQLEKQGSLLNAEKRKELIDSAQKKYAAFQEFYQKKQNETLEKRAEILKPIEESLLDVIKKIGMSEKYDFIFDEATGRLLWAQSQYDMSARILDLLPPCAGGAAAKGTAPAAKKGEPVKKK